MATNNETNAATTQTTLDPAIGDELTIKGRSYKVFEVLKDGYRICRLRKGKQSLTVGLEGKRGGAYMANWCCADRAFFGGLTRV